MMPCSAVLSPPDTAEIVSGGLMLKILQTRTSPSGAWPLAFDGFLKERRDLRCFLACFSLR